jgi:hypothetical protein
MRTVKCRWCDKEATGSLSIDIDVKSMFFCEEHEEKTNLLMLAAIMGDENLIKELEKDNNV